MKLGLMVRFNILPSDKRIVENKINELSQVAEEVIGIAAGSSKHINDS